MTLLGRASRLCGRRAQLARAHLIAGRVSSRPSFPLSRPVTACVRHFLRRVDVVNDDRPGRRCTTSLARPYVAAIDTHGHLLLQRLHVSQRSLTSQSGLLQRWAPGVIRAAAALPFGIQFVEEPRQRRAQLSRLRSIRRTKRIR